MALFTLNVRTVVISMTLQKLEPRAIYLQGPDSSDLKAFFRKSFLKTWKVFWVDHLLAIACIQIT